MSSDQLALDLAKSSKGFMTKDDYKRKREELEVEEKLAKVRAATATTSKDGAAAVEKKKKKKKDKKGPGMLSFEDELDAEAEPSPSLQPKMGKCQQVDVSFLKRNDREEQEAALKKEQAMRDYLKQQQTAKLEKVTVSYTFRSEATQREVTNGVLQGSVTVEMGCTAEQVACRVRDDVHAKGGKFAALSVAGVKEERDVMLTLCTGESVLGSFAIPPSIPMLDLSKKTWIEGEKLFDGFKGGIIVTERRHYESVKHVHPYSQWKLYDEKTSYSLAEFIAGRGAGTGVDPIIRSLDGRTANQRTGR